MGKISPNCILTMCTFYSVSPLLSTVIAIGLLSVCLSVCLSVMLCYNFNKNWPMIVWFYHMAVRRLISAHQRLFGNLARDLCKGA